MTKSVIRGGGGSGLVGSLRGENQACSPALRPSIPSRTPHLPKLSPRIFGCSFLKASLHREATAEAEERGRREKAGPIERGIADPAEIPSQ
ncbi:MAG: hypothetical protein ACPIOQ_33130, partial [Promethearchaeia archaeon]